MMAVTVCGVFFAAVELLLAAWGVRPNSNDEEASVGFAAYSPLFVEDVGPDGQTTLVTAANRRRHFNVQRFPRAKKRSTFRVFGLGGSTTFGRPYDDMTSFSGWLRRMLAEAEPSRDWQVINAGGISYASHRLVVLMEELIQYEPDLFVIYCGHNEFLERQTYGQLMDTPSAIRHAKRIVDWSRLYALVQQAVGPSDTAPDHGDARRSALPREVETLLEQSIGPQAYRRDAVWHQQVLDRYRVNLRRMVDLAHSVDASVILVTPASNLRHCSPFKSASADGIGDADLARWQSIFDRAQAAHAGEQWDQALVLADEAIRLDDRRAELHYLRGQVLWASGRHQQALEALERARDEDVCPLRATSSMIDTVAQTAASTRAELIDYVALCASGSPHGTAGEEMFLDHVHPTIHGHRRLAEAILETMTRLRLVRPVTAWNRAAAKRMAQRVMASLDTRSHGIALRNVAMVYRWAGKFEDGGRLALKATRMAPDDAEARFLVAATAADQGRTSEAIDHYRKTIELQPDHARAHCELGGALAARNRHVEAIAHYRQALRIRPDYDDAHCNLANALATIGVQERSQSRRDKAIHHYRLALQANPRHVAAHSNLGNVLASSGRYDQAIVHYHLALQSSPGFAAAHQNLGHALRLTGRPDEAIHHFRQALQITADSPKAHYGLGLALHATARGAPAIEHLKLAVQLDPGNAEVRAALSRIIQEE